MKTWRVLDDSCLPNLYVSANDEGHFVTTLQLATDSGIKHETIDRFSDINQVIELLISVTLEQFRSKRRYVDAAELETHVDDYIASLHEDEGVGYWVYDTDMLVNVLEGDQCVLTIGNEMYRGDISDVDVHLWTWAIGEGYVHGPLMRISDDPSDNNLMLYFHELAARNSMYHLDDDPSDIPFTHVLTDQDRITLLNNHRLMHTSTRSSKTDLWDLIRSRPCAKCAEHTFVDSTLCGQCSSRSIVV